MAHLMGLLHPAHPLQRNCLESIEQIIVGVLLKSAIHQLQCILCMTNTDLLVS